ncbi:MAG: glycosyltransferase family 2 protein [Nitrospirae bacterium]|nr:MAG: glycosyltransferase family 2 protein [Nitrospirota bacterium]
MLLEHPQTSLSFGTHRSHDHADPELSIVIPCLNEAQTLAQCLRKANLAIATHRLHAEIIVVDNGSQDGSPAIAQACGARVIHVSERGYGAALQAGIQEATGRFVIMGDADDSYDFSAIFPFLEKLRAGYDLVMGCRFPHAGGTIMPGAMPWLHRWIGNPILSAIGRLFFRSPVQDFHCGLRAFRRDAILALDLRAPGMEFASEMVIKATLQGLNITEIPITLHKDGRHRRSHLRTWRDGWRHLRFMLLYSPRWLFLVPGMILFIMGMGVGIWLLFGPRTIRGVTFDTNTLLVAAMTMLIGFNLITFAIFSKAYGIATRLLPEDPLFRDILNRCSLEKGIICGLTTLALGAGLLLLGIWQWSLQGFGPLSYPDSLRLVIPGTTILTLGVEIVFSSFLLSLLQVSPR